MITVRARELAKPLSASITQRSVRVWAAYSDEDGGSVRVWAMGCCAECNGKPLLDHRIGSYVDVATSLVFSAARSVNNTVENSRVKTFF